MVCPHFGLLTAMSKAGLTEEDVIPLPERIIALIERGSAVVKRQAHGILVENVSMHTWFVAVLLVCVFRLWVQTGAMGWKHTHIESARVDLWPPELCVYVSEPLSVPVYATHQGAENV